MAKTPCLYHRPLQAAAAEGKPVFKGTWGGQDRLGIIVIDMHMNTPRCESSPGRRLRQIFPPERVRTISNICELLSYARTVGIPIFLVGYHSDSFNPDILQAAGSFEGPVIKSTHDAFRSSDLDTYLTARGIGTVLVAGFHKKACVFETARSATAAYRVITSDAVMLCDNANPYANNPGYDGLFYLTKTEHYWTFRGLMGRVKEFALLPRLSPYHII